MNRKRVIWLGAMPAGAEEFQRRQLTIQQPLEDEIERLLPTTCGLVIRYDIGKPAGFAHAATRFVRLAKNHGVLVFVIAGDSRSQALAGDILRRENVTHCVRPRTAPPLYEVAEEIARHYAGPGCPDPPAEIVYKGDLDETSRLLLTRAFFDCRRITLEALTGGRSASTYVVHALFADSIVGPRPLPFFAKIDDAAKIERERQNYTLYASHFIPFNLRPNLEEHRCLIGAEKGILVGNFVEQSEPLFDVAARGHAQMPIYSLFDNGLRGWRLQAAAASRPMLEELEDLVDPARIDSDLLSLARGRGAEHEPRTLIEILRRHGPRRYMSAPTHRDLHGFNVRVRAGDAILIDFASTRVGPLAVDAASLEVSFAMQAGPHDSDDDGWADIVTTLYSVEMLRRPPPPPLEPSRREWLWSSVRQIRLTAYAQQIEPQEYALAVAICLLRRSQYDAESPSDRFRRGYAYVLADRIIRSIEAGEFR